MSRARKTLPLIGQNCLKPPAIGRVAGSGQETRSLPKVVKLEELTGKVPPTRLLQWQQPVGGRQLRWEDVGQYGTGGT